LRLEGSLNVFRYSPFDPYIRLYLYTRSVYMCGFFRGGGLYIYAIEMFSLSDDEQWSSSLGFFYSLACVASRVSYRDPSVGDGL
jgi:hypothetical protein